MLLPRLEFPVGAMAIMASIHLVIRKWMTVKSRTSCGESDSLRIDGDESLRFHISRILTGSEHDAHDWITMLPNASCQPGSAPTP